MFAAVLQKSPQITEEEFDENKFSLTKDIKKNLKHLKNPMNFSPKFPKLEELPSH